MEHRFYKSFVKNIEGYLKNDGFKELQRSKLHLMIEFVGEEIIIPRRFHEKATCIKIYFCKDGKVQEVFSTRTEYIRIAEYLFKKFYKQRMMEQSLRTQF